MDRPSNVEEFLPHRTRVKEAAIKAALADLNPVETTLGLSIALPYTERADGTVDTVEIGPYNPTDNWVVYTGRAYRGRRHSATVTSQVARCPGHMAVLVARALYAHLTAVGPQGRADTLEGDILYALGLSRPTDAAAAPVTP